MNHRPHLHGSAFRLIAGWCGLLIYVAVLSPFGMGVAAILGALDPNHHAVLQPGASEMRLVLRHDVKCAGHHHGIVARALTLFSQPTSATNPDHVLQFSSVTGFTRDSQLIVPSASQSEPIVVVLVEPVACAEPIPVRFRPSPRPPPGDAGKLLSLRSTVLLV
jgi:hypothetical protein